MKDAQRYRSHDAYRLHCRLDHLERHFPSWMRRLFRSPGQTYNVGMNEAKRRSDSFAMNNKQKRRNRSALRRGIAGVLSEQAA